MCGDLFARKSAGIEPPLTGESHHAHEHVGVHRGHLAGETARTEFDGQTALHLAGHVAEQRCEVATGTRDGGIAQQDPEAVVVGLDVVEQDRAHLGSGALADPTRLRIVARLAGSSATVSELVAMTDLSQPLVSWHLRRLRVAGVVTTKRSGREVVCSIDRETLGRFHEEEHAMLGIPAR